MLFGCDDVTTAWAFRPYSAIAVTGFVRNQEPTVRDAFAPAETGTEYGLFFAHSFLLAAFDRFSQ